MKLAYRPEIDGLRAIAVLAVVFYHSELVLGGDQLLSGGFLGVDIFFVISGYLITQIIFRQLSSDTFSFVAFYDRRVRRLLPSLVSVALASTIAAYFLLGSIALEEFSGSVISALGFFSNFYFWGLDEYVAEPSQLRPFLHTWSLGIEEQFYILAPVVLAAGFALRKNSLPALIVTVSILSFAYAIILVQTDPKSAFYLMPTRAWEFGVGALIGFFATDPSKPVSSNQTGNAIQLSALLVLIISLFVFGDKRPHPSVWTAIPVLATAVFIYFSTSTSLVTKVVGSQPATWVGRISYSLYLWHWPMIVFAKHQTTILLPSIVWALISIIPAAVSYYLIEKPLRYGSRLISYSFILIGVSALLAFHFFSWFNDGIPQRLSNAAVRFSEIETKANNGRLQAMRWHDCHLIPGSKSIGSSCNIQSDEKPNIVVVGDSLAADLFAAYRHGYPEYNFLQFTGGGCDHFPTDAPHCKIVWNELFAHMDTYTNDVDLAVFHGRNMPSVDWSELFDRLADTKVLVVLPRPEITPNPRGSLEKMELKFAPEVDNVAVRESYRLDHRNQMIAEIRSQAGSLGFEIVDISEYVFPNDQIDMFSSNGDLNFLDYAHWSGAFGRVVGDRLKASFPTLPID